VEELGSAASCGLVTGIVIKTDFVGQFRMDLDNSGSIICDGAVVERQASGANKCVAPMIGGIPFRIRKDCREGVDPPKLTLENLLEDGEKRFPDQQEGVVSGLPFEGGKGISSLLEMERDCIRHHA
jgi:hypothetical protein